MSVLINVNRHTIFGPIHREGWQQGREEGLTTGRLDGERRFALRQLTYRYGKVPARYLKRVDAMDAHELETLSIRLLHAASLAELFD